ncbi:MAG: decaprenyl-phosphate phosphoribosyltransferase [Bacteroidota bacterium]|nr:decaprenyl-phosphate phosphoribosyltransferase [Bacteroidota bacterium]
MTENTVRSAERRRSVTIALLAAMRPRQWTKNLVVLSPLLFSRHFFELDVVLRSLAAFALFSLTASAIYLFNDVVDLNKDREHPVKRHRPIASGELPIPVALTAFALLTVLCGVCAFFLSPTFFAVIAAYFVLNVVYTVTLKETVIIDVMAISASFLLRIVGGACAIHVPLSEWLLICASLLALFLGFSKRRHELTLLEANATAHRPVLEEYNTYFLDQMISLVTASTLIGYILYTVSPDTVEKFGSKNLLWTVPFVLYGLFRYLYLVHQKKTGGDPTAELLTDWPLLLNVFLWAVSVMIVISFP